MKTEATVVVQDVRLPEDSLIFEGIDTTHGAGCRFQITPCGDKCYPPIFTVSEVAKVFFGQSAHWVRWREGKGYFVFDGEPVGTRRAKLKNGEEGARIYYLEDIEKMVHALASQGALTQAQFTNALIILQSEGKIWKYLP